MKRKTDLVKEEHESEKEENESSGDESEDEEPRIKDVLSTLSQAVLEKRASELLHSMQGHFQTYSILDSPQTILLLQNTQIIPVTNITELFELFVTKPRTLNTFQEGLAELGVNKG